MPERNFRKSPARAAAAAAAAAGHNVSPRQRSPGRRAEKSPGRRAEKSPARRTEKSPARRKEKSPSRTGRSPSRSTQKQSPTKKSPTKKSPSRTKSPGRKPKSPARTLPDVVIPRKEEIIQEPTVRLYNHERGDGYDFPSRMRGSSREPSSSSSVVIVRRTTRITAAKEFGDKLESKGIEKLKADDNADLDYPEKPLSSKSASDVREFGGWFAVLLMEIFLPLTVLVANIYCSKLLQDQETSRTSRTSTSQKASELNVTEKIYWIKDFKIPLDWKAYFDLEVAALYLGFVVLQLVLSIIPIGKLVDGMPNKLGRIKYRCNGLFSAFVTLAVLGGLRYYKFPVTMIVDKSIQFLVTGLIFGYIVSVLLFIRGGLVPTMAQNSYAVTGNKIYDFWMGREVNPKIGPFHVKIGLCRIAVIGMMVMNAALVLKSLEQGSGYSPTLILAAALQIWYPLDNLWFEDSFLTTFEYMYEGTGYMFTVGCTLYPFIPTIITRILLNYRLETPLYALAIIAVVNTIGYVIFRGSNSQKSEFRKNPLNPALAHLETIPTTRGKKLLVSGWWGWVRHPNYLGDLIMHWSWASVCGLAHPLPYLMVPLPMTILLLHRAKRDDHRCKQRYNAAWERYCNRVKYRIVPKVY